jgi:hypothetical protein
MVDSESNLFNPEATEFIPRTSEARELVPEAQEFVPGASAPSAPVKLQLEELKTAFSGNYADLNLLTPAGIFIFKAKDKRWVSHSKVLEADMLPVLKYSAAVLISEHTLVITGGLHPSSRTPTPLLQVKKLTLSIDWGRRTELLEDLPNLLEARYMHCSVWHRGQILVIGGQVAPDCIIASCEAFGQTWQSIASLNIPRSCATAVVHQDSVYVIGGFSSKGELAHGLEVLTEGSWTLFMPTVFLGAGVGVTVTPSNTFLLIGGGDGEAPQSIVKELQIESYELTSNTWMLKFPRARPLCCKGNWVFFGGCGEGEKIKGSSVEVLSNLPSVPNYDSIVYPSFTKPS